MNTRTSTFVFVATFFVATLSLPVFSAATTFYVKAGAAGDGSSWVSPFGDLQKALHRAKAGDVINVAEGTYYPSTEGNRSETFILPRGVQMLGGFKGNEANTSTRNWEQQITILSGNIGSNDRDDNSYNVVTIKGGDNTTILDGFTIEDGYANGDRMAGAEVRNVGGGLYNEGWKGRPSNPVIANCTFRNHYAKDGGAVYNNGRTGEASPSFKNCIFENNQTDLDGGAVYNDARQKGISSPTFVDCHFTGNKGNYGGAVMNYGVGGKSESAFLNCYFTDNAAYGKGGAVFNISTQALEMEDYRTSTFSNNVALDHDSDNVYHHLMADKSTKF